jgi:CMP-N-acetylneuraminic acid synthetase
MLNGSIYVSSPSVLVNRGSFHTPHTVPYIMDKKYSIDIDTQEDFEIVERLIQ